MVLIQSFLAQMTSYLEFKLLKHMHFCYFKYRILIQELRALTSQYIFSQKFYLKAPVNIIKFILHKMLLFLVKFKMFYIDRHLANPFVHENYNFFEFIHNFSHYQIFNHDFTRKMPEKLQKIHHSKLVVKTWKSLL